MHCIAEGDGPPLLLLHGWPSSVWEFHRIVPLLRDPLRVVVPSLPGYGFSAARRAGIVEMADALHALMGALGHSRYLVAGGDWGASIACRLAYAYPDAVEALHLYMLPIRRASTWPESESASREALEHWLQEEGGYVHIQGTRPQTLTYGLHDSPVGLLSWIAEKFDVWTDSRGVPDDDVLTTATIYWATGTIGTSFWPYYARIHGEWVLDDVIEAGERVRAPLTFLDFPKEIVHVPRAVAERVFDVERWEEPDYGGHFPALEATDVLADSLRTLHAPIDRTFSSRTPRGVSSFTASPTRVPISALPIGDSTDTLPSAGSDSGADTSVYVVVLPRPVSSTSTLLPKPTTSVCVSTSRTSALISCSRIRRIFVSKCAWSFLASWYSEFSLRSPHSRAVLIRSAISARATVSRCSSSVCSA